MTDEVQVKIPMFDGTSFGLWKKRILLAMKSRRLDKALEPENESKVTEAQDIKAQELLLNTIDAKVAQKVLACKSAAEIWARLKAIYENSGSVNVGHLLRTYYNYRKDPKSDMSTHISRVEDLALQLQDVGQEQTEESIMSKLLDSLPAKFDALKEAWDSVDPERRTRDALTARMLRYDIAKTELEDSNANGVALMAKGPKNLKKRRPLDKSKIKCYECGQMGHFGRECRAAKAAGITPSKTGSGGTFGSNAGVALVIGGQKNPSDYWVVDSGASSHICCRRDWFTSMEDCDDELQVGNEQLVKAAGRGEVVLKCKVGKTVRTVTLKDVLYMTEMGFNLFSTIRATNNGANISFDKSGCRVFVNGKLTAVGMVDPSRNICYLDAQTKPGVALLVSTRRTIKDWHEALGHVDPQVISEMAKNRCVDGLELIEPTNEPCGICPMGKGTRASHNQAPTIEPKAVGDQVDLDLVDAGTESLGSQRYILLARDTFSRYNFIKFIRTKDEVCSKLQEIISEFEVESGHKVQIIRTDNGSEFVNHKVSTLLGLEHIKLHCSAPYTPEQNGGAERNNRTILGDTRAMLAQSGLLPELWAEAANTAAYIRNRIPKRGTGQTPFEVFRGRRPFVGHIVTFGCPVQTLITGRHLGKFDPKTEDGHIVGFTERTNTYRVFIPHNKRVKVTSDVIFRNHATRTNQVTETVSQPTSQVTSAEITLKSNLDAVQSDEHHENVLEQYFRDLDVRGGRHETTSSSNQPAQPSAPPICDQTGYFSVSDDVESPEFSPFTEREQSSAADASGQEVRSSTPVSDDPGVVLAVTEDSSCALDPQSYAEAMHCPRRREWKLAVASEIEAHRRNRTWQIVKRPPDAKLLTAKWVFATKRDSGGAVEKYKARLVARGFQQREGVDFQETFAPVARHESIRILLALAVARDKCIKRFDVSTAFLNGIIEEDVYMEPPEGIEGLDDSLCLKLRRALYGLRQAPRVWNSMFDSTVRDLGFVATKSDPCIYYNRLTGVMMAVYVDDGLVVGGSEIRCNRVISDLQKSFDVKCITGDTFLGMKIVRSREGIHLSQTRFVDDALRRFNLEGCKPQTSPLVDTKILFEDCSEQANVPYRSAIGSLLYLAVITRPDILYATNLLAKFTEQPKTVHWAAVKRVLRYLEGTKTTGLQFKGPCDKLTVEVYCDADWAGDLSDRKSTTGVLVLLCGSPVVFASRRQSVVAQSSTEAEYMAAAEATKELVWVASLLTELEIKFELPKILIDNTSALSLIKNHDVKRRSKHIEIRYHYVREMYKLGWFRLEHVGSNYQKADFLTKRLPSPKFEAQLKMAGIEDLTTGTDSGARERVLGLATAAAGTDPKGSGDQKGVSSPTEEH